MASKPTPPPQGRNFTFTDFELSDKEASYHEYKDEIRAVAWATEVCPTTQREHHQGYIQTVKRARHKKVQKLLKSPTAHIEVMRGSILDSEIYCEKTGVLNVLGEFVRQGKRTDLATAAKMLSDGKTMRDVLDTDVDLFAHNHKALQVMKGIYDRDNRQGDREVTTTVLVGLSGSGKSHQVMGLDDLFVLDAGASGDFQFDGYDGERNLLIDDFNGWIKYTFLLRVLDKYRLSLNVKHGRTWANWDNVYITTNVRPAYWYNNIQTANLQRRVTSVYEVTVRDGQQGVNIEQDKFWAFDLKRDTQYEGNAYG